MWLKLILFWNVFFLPAWPSFAHELVAMTLQVSTAQQGPEARHQAFDQATEQATQRLVEELMGPAQAAKNWPILKPKLLAESGRYVLSIKGSPETVQDGLTHITVNMKLSTDNLATLLREQGYLGTGTIRLLPLIRVEDYNGESYAWWAHPEAGNAPTSSEKLFGHFFTALRAKAKVKNIYTLDPTQESFRLGVPTAYRVSNLGRPDQKQLAQYLKADVVLSGKISIERSSQNQSGLRLVYDLNLWQARSGESIAEVLRSENLVADRLKIVVALSDQMTPHLLDDLLDRLGQVIARGDLNLNIVRIAVDGDLNFRQEAGFKALLSNLKGVRVLRERLFEPSKVVFEAETPATGSTLAHEISSTRFPGYRVQVENGQDNRLALQVKAL